MGAVQKLATVVIIGLVALATALTVYIADEPNRRGSEGTEQDVIAIERGTELYIQYCLQCHGPDGAGRNGGDGRIGGVLNQAWGEGAVTYQSDDPGLQAEAEAWAHYRITYGVPAEPIQPVKQMPAFGTELNVEEINDLVYLIMYGDWNYVYNTAVTEAGHTVQEETCAEDPDAQICDEEHPVAYPTVPPTEVPEDEEGGEGGEGTPEAGNGAAVTINAQDTNQWDVTEVTAKAGDTVAINNPGVITHDFTIDDLGVDIDLPSGAEETWTIPADLAPGTYTFHCSVPGHETMTGTLTIEG